MSETFRHLFSPLALRHLQLKNRITFGAHTANMSEDGLPGAPPRLLPGARPRRLRHDRGRAR